MTCRKPGNFYKRAASVGTTIGWWIIPVAVMSTIWAPVILHYYFPNPIITAEIVAEGRQVPPDELLDELKHFYYHKLLNLQQDDAVVYDAESILEGRLERPGLPTLILHMPFDPEDLEKVPLEWQLELAALGIPKLLLEAYEHSHRDEFLIAARDSILEWASFERRAWLPKGLLWNDHAVAARTLVLSNFWRIYRHSHLYRDEVAKTIFEFAARSAQFLASPAHFTFATNHGVMQNLGLWHLALSFPTLPGSSEYAQLALMRLREQMPYYLSGEGVILEHSAGYQEFGLNLLSLAFRYMTHYDLPVERQWREEYEKAKDYYALLSRPDKTLPIFGDTVSQPSRLGPPIVDLDEMGMSNRLYHDATWTPQHANNLFPISGYFIRWEGLEHWPHLSELNQTVVTWSYFPGHGHKHADEMSVVLWANGETWLTNHGYWTGAEQWDGSNAPHLRMEDRKSVRKTELKFHGWSDDLALVDLERKGPGDYSVRRELIRVKPHLWLIFDQSSGTGTDVTTTSWITPDKVSWNQTERSNVFNLKGRDPQTTMTVSFAGSTGTTFRKPPISEKFGSGEWGTKTGLVVEQPANDSWALSAWVLNDPSHSKFKPVGNPVVSHLTSAENWVMLLPGESGNIQISRDRARLFVTGPEKSDTSMVLTLHAAENVDAQVGEIRGAYEQVARTYPPRFHDLLFYRTKASVILALIFILQELVFVAMPSQWYVRLRLLNALCWVGGGVWFHLVYLV